MTIANPAAAVLIIGNEILSGRTIDCNLTHIAKELGAMGIIVREARVVPDIEDEIIAAVDALRQRYDYVFTTGGIGPTHDDITSAAIARSFGVPLTIDPEARRRLEAHYGPNGLNPARLRMATVPTGALLIDNPISAAPGFRIGNVFVMAGIPVVMRAMLAEILPALVGGQPVLNLTIDCDLAEGVFAAGLTAIQETYPAIDIGSYPRVEASGPRASLVLRGLDADELQRAALEVQTLIASLGGHGSLPG